MCKGAHKTHKRSGAQAQAKRLKPQNGIKELNEKKMAKMKKERSQGLDKRDQRCYEPQEKQIKARMKL